MQHLRRNVRHLTGKKPLRSICAVSLAHTARAGTCMLALLESSGDHCRA